MFTHKTFVLSISIIVLAICSTASTQQQSDETVDRVSPAPYNSPSENMPEDNLSVAYARACLRLANAELAEAREQNRLVNKSVADYDIKRMLLQVRFAEQNLSHSEQGADFSQSILGHVTLQSQLANHDLKAAEELRNKNENLITDAQLERLRSYAEVCRLRTELTSDPVSTLTLVDHLHWETHRLSEEVLQLDRRIARLEETTNR
ncbi:hypothetical protein [Bythopirellula polymerisocia]|uniref:DUF4398 domain-containing protein n=1 Tax=Bythopirellula polymerisocia TaxID=2528003 RepID=A0A5C6C1R9_9BACT|nr:hypothetical protein [Bythopirellula polymerisocia]TWU17456.1 hypothetical protein Pla144_51310 [Bythopirellula polymerisocia]